MEMSKTVICHGAISDSEFISGIDILGTMHKNLTINCRTAI